MVGLNKQGPRPSTALASRVSPLSALISCFYELNPEPPPPPTNRPGCPAGRSGAFLIPSDVYLFISSTSTYSYRNILS